MEIKEIPFKGKLPTTDAVSLKTLAGASWSGSLQLPAGWRAFGRLISSIHISNYGAFRVSGQFSYEDKLIPDGLDDFKEGFILAPWCDTLRLNSCATSLLSWMADDRIIFDFDVVNQFALKQRYQFQLHLLLKESNLAEAHYYGCTSGNESFVGMVGDVGNTTGWELKPNQLYARKALSFNTTQLPTDTGTIITPFGPEPAIDPPKPDEDEPLIPIPIGTWERVDTVHWEYQRRKI